MPSSDDPKEPLNPDDKAVWERYTRKGERSPKPEPEDFASLLDGKSKPDNGILRQENQTIAKPHIGQQPSLPQGSPQLDRRTEEKLRKGKMPIEATLDLHGMNQAKAHQALNDFIVASATSNMRCVLVITGKGVSTRKSDDWLDSPKGVLREKVPEWLQSGLLSRHVLKYFPAQPKDGGAGALYVYLKRQR